MANQYWTSSFSHFVHNESNPQRLLLVTFNNVPWHVRAEWWYFGNGIVMSCRKSFGMYMRTDDATPDPFPFQQGHSPLPSLVPALTHRVVRPSVRSFSGNVMNTFTDPKLCASNNHRSLIDGSPGTHYSCSTCPFATKLLRLLLLPYLGITALTY